MDEVGFSISPNPSPTDEPKLQKEQVASPPQEDSHGHRHRDGALDVDAKGILMGDDAPPRELLKLAYPCDTTTTHNDTQHPSNRRDQPAVRPSQRSPSETYLGPADAIGEHDSRIIHNLPLPAGAFASIQDEVCWQKMYHLSGQVPRLIAVQGQGSREPPGGGGGGGAIPIYRHPADEAPPLSPFTPTVDRVRVLVERILGHPLNHVLVQLYRDGRDHITEHSDKTLDIVRGSFICNVSLGARRVMVLRSKNRTSTSTSTSTKTKTSAGHSTSTDETRSRRQTQRVPLPHESLFVLGEKTNMRWVHGVRPDKRPDSAKCPEERSYNGARISLTFRHIGTFLEPAAGTIWGQGAVSKTREGAGLVVNNDPVATEELIRAFGQENRSAEFDWDAVYGAGFDVVDFVTTGTATATATAAPAANTNTALLAASGDQLTDLPTRTVVSRRDRPAVRDDGHGHGHGSFRSIC